MDLELWYHRINYFNVAGIRMACWKDLGECSMRMGRSIRAISIKGNVMGRAYMC